MYTLALVRRAVPLFVIFCLACAMLPGNAELVEKAYRLAVQGDFAADQENTPIDSAHGCGACYLCSSCHLQPLLVASDIDVASGENPGAAFLLPFRLPYVLQGYSLRLENPPRA